MQEVERARRQLRRQLGRQPEIQEIARFLYPIDPAAERGKRSQTYIRHLLPESPAEREAEIRTLADPDDPLQVPLAVTRHLLPESSGESEPESTRLLREKMDDLLASLQPKERAVLELRFGLLDGRPRTLEEVAEQFGISRQDIRNIEARALKKLRHPTRSRWPKR